MTDVGLNDVDCACGEKVVELYAINKPLAGSQRYPRVRRDCFETGDLAGRDGFFYEIGRAGRKASIYARAAAALAGRP